MSVCLTLFSHCRTGSTLSFSGTPQTTEEFSTWWWMQAKFGFLTFYCITSKLVHPIIRKKNRTEQTCHLLKAPWKGDDSVNFFAVFNPHNIKEWVKFTIFDNHNFSIGIQPNALHDQMTQFMAFSNSCHGIHCSIQFLQLGHLQTNGVPLQERARPYKVYQIATFPAIWLVYFAKIRFQTCPTSSWSETFSHSGS